MGDKAKGGTGQNWQNNKDEHTQQTDPNKKKNVLKSTTLM